jgi:hypothetical protein
MRLYAVLDLDLPQQNLGIQQKQKGRVRPYSFGITYSKYNPSKFIQMNEKIKLSKPSYVL